VGFTEIGFEIADGNLLGVFDHPNQARYPGQRVFVVRHADYAYLVPYVEDEQWTFLKTIVPSRFAGVAPLCLRAKSARKAAKFRRAARPREANSARPLRSAAPAWGRRAPKPA